MNILQKNQEDYTFEKLKSAYRIYMETKRYLIFRGENAILLHVR